MDLTGSDVVLGLRLSLEFKKKNWTISNSRPKSDGHFPSLKKMSDTLQPSKKCRGLSRLIVFGLLPSTKCRTNECTLSIADIRMKTGQANASL